MEKLSFESKVEDRRSGAQWKWWWLWWWWWTGESDSDKDLSSTDWPSWALGSSFQKRGEICRKERLLTFKGGRARVTTLEERVLR